MQRVRSVMLTLGACALAGAAFAGEAPGETFTMAVPPPGAQGFAIQGPLEGFETKLVKGAPYSADSVTEMVQALADGNRIVHTTKGSVQRDSDGRTRREQTLGALGPMMAQGDGPRHVFINDPVAGAHYILDLDEKVARKMPALLMLGGGEPHQGVQRLMRYEKRVNINGVEQTTVEETDGPADGEKARTESLGQQTIEGVTADGTRTTITIPAGRIGNERAIEIVSERWYSPQLQVVVLSKQRDPRFGETTYRLTNISRDEPDASLFTVPADFTVKEGPPHDVVKVIRRNKQD